MLHRFFGGVHPKDKKDATHDLEIAALEHPPGQIVLPMSMHVGAPCAPVVAVGDKVLVGQVIARPTGLGAPIHASVSGAVVAVEPRAHAGGVPVLSVVIENDGLDAKAPPLARPAHLEKLTAQQTIDLICEAGIVGMGGAGFPTHVKLSSAQGKVDTLILNGAECEPYITADHRLMLEQPDKVIGGARILMRALGLNQVTIGVEGNKVEAVSALQARLTLRGSDVKVKTLRVRYPQGAEKQLIQRMTGRQIPPGGLPADVGCAVFNVATAAAVYDAVVEGLPLTHRVVTVTGAAITSPKNLLVPIGTPMELLAEYAGGIHGTQVRVLCGGPMMGIAQFDLAAPVMKGTNCLLFLKHGEYAQPQPAGADCIRCGKCVDNCPMHLMPVYIHQYAEEGRFGEMDAFRVMDCIECGSCAYGCPAHIPLVQGIRAVKAQLRKPPKAVVLPAEKPAPPQVKPQPKPAEDKKDEVDSPKLTPPEAVAPAAETPAAETPAAKPAAATEKAAPQKKPATKKKSTGQKKSTGGSKSKKKGGSKK